MPFTGVMIFAISDNINRLDKGGELVISIKLRVSSAWIDLGEINHYGLTKCWLIISTCLVIDHTGMEINNVVIWEWKSAGRVSLR